ncbi:MAG: cytoplasmic protein [Proteobacteria bacterium]|nr:cytoplasmic protein [Pseudomonadota bacterium]MBU1582388.1 cytoplasmic protein [Pseudomonadota bacterium]MBU2452172.1 cytoplasmic protein [Pseudomonadota bacterium]MBU2631802.1 cytoplasmic protein [Pseudomonadota bacterium]
MKKDTHNFIQEYKGLGAFGLDRKTDEETIMFYLQKFSEDSFLKTLLPRLSDQELEEIYLFINNKIKQHLSEHEYHGLFLKDR